MPFNIGPAELILVLVIVLLIFGPGKLPDVGNAIGRGIREFRKASSDLEDSIRGETKTPPAEAGPTEATVLGNLLVQVFRGGRCSSPGSSGPLNAEQNRANEEDVPAHQLTDAYRP